MLLTLFRHISKNFFRPCDSTNLNLNPLCQLKKKGEPNIWANSVKQSYTKKEKYIQELRNSNRSYYKDTKSREDELIPGIQKVIDVVHNN